MAGNVEDGAGFLEEGPSENYYGYSYEASGIFNYPGSPSGRQINTFAGQVIDPDPSYNFTRSVKIIDGDWDSECLEDRLKPFIRPVQFQDKDAPSDFRIQDSYIHHKSSWDGYENMGAGNTATDANGNTVPVDSEYVEILFLSRAKKSDKKFEKYKDYAPNFNGYYDAQFDRYEANKDEDLIDEGDNEGN